MVGAQAVEQSAQALTFFRKGCHFSSIMDNLRWGVGIGVENPNVTD